MHAETGQRRFPSLPPTPSTHMYTLSTLPVQHGWRPLHFAVKACASQQGGEGGVAMVALLLLVQGDSGMLATQKRERVKKSGEETTKNKVCISMALLCS